MKIATVLDHMDSGHMALPEFQRGYVWNRDQVRGLFDSLYRRHPVGGLLVWATEAKTAAHRGDGTLAPGVVKMLLDGQQRITSLYGVARGKHPKFFDGNPQAFTGLQFNLGTEVFAFLQPLKMQDDPLWIDVTSLLKGGNNALAGFVTTLGARPEHTPKIGEYVARLSRVLGILEISLHVEEVTGHDKTLDVVVDIFNRVNSGGTKLSKGDLALAKICAEWPEARVEMKAKLKEWESAGYHFSLDWLLRSVNTTLTGEAKFSYLDQQNAPDIQDGLKRAVKHIETSLNLISGRLGLDHDRVFFGRFGVPVMVRYLDRKKGFLDAKERDKLLFWFAQAGMWGRFSGSTETIIDQDLAALESAGGGLDELLEQLRFWHGGLRVEPGHFAGSTLSARFYPILYMLTRMGDSRDWGSGLPLKANMLGKMNRLEVHHIFPKAQLYKLKDPAGKPRHARGDVNALANFCFLAKNTNLDISDRLPEEYFPEIEANHPGALASQWIPTDRELWRVDRYLDFLQARRALLAAEANRRFQGLLHDDLRWMTTAAAVPAADSQNAGGITTEAEEAEVEDFNLWIEKQSLPRGEIGFDLHKVGVGEQEAVLDLAWPDGLQPGLSGPVAAVLSQSGQVLSIATAAGYRCFASLVELKAYIQAEFLQLENT